MPVYRSDDKIFIITRNSVTDAQFLTDANEISGDTLTLAIVLPQNLQGEATLVLEASRAGVIVERDEVATAQASRIMFAKISGLSEYDTVADHIKISVVVNGANVASKTFKVKQLCAPRRWDFVNAYGVWDSFYFEAQEDTDVILEAESYIDTDDNPERLVVDFFDQHTLNIAVLQNNRIKHFMQLLESGHVRENNQKVVITDFDANALASNTDVHKFKISYRYGGTVN
jgi:hypothetical protein